MNSSCNDFRSQWLTEPGALPHAEACAACAAWARSTERQMQLLAKLERVQAPAELEARVARELDNGGADRLERLLTSLVHPAAPESLDQRLAAALREPESEAAGEVGSDPRVGVLGTLDRQSAPPVLDRLLEEELADPRAQVARFSGGLEKLRAPAALEKRVEGALRRRTFLRLALVPVASLAAAGLVVWLTLRSAQAPAPTYSFRVLHPTSVAGLSPLGRQMAQALGALPAVPPGASSGEAPR